MLDLYSRKVVGFEVHDTDSAEHAAPAVNEVGKAEVRRKLRRSELIPFFEKQEACKGIRISGVPGRIGGEAVIWSNEATSEAPLSGDTHAPAPAVTQTRRL